MPAWEIRRTLFFTTFLYQVHIDSGRVGFTEQRLSLAPWLVRTLAQTDKREMESITFWCLIDSNTTQTQDLF